MSSILYTLIDGEVVKEKVAAVNVDYLLGNGYADTPDKLLKKKEADTNESGKISDKEVKEAAEKAGIKIGKKTIKTLKKELGL